MIHTIRKISKRLRSARDLAHMPSGRGKGKWHNRKTLWAYKCLTRRRRKIASASRRRNAERAK